MKIRTLLPKFDSNTWYSDLLHHYGIDDVAKWEGANESDLEPPTFYRHIDDAVDMLQDAIQNHKQVAVIVDCDLDGYCSAAIATLFLKQFGLEPIPLFHLHKQHGLEPEMVAQILYGERPIDMVWIPDAGSNDVSAAEKLVQAGISVLVTDHHEITAENNYAVVVNNCYQGQNTNPHLSGAGVTEKVVSYFCQRNNMPKQDYNDLVALSIISDSCSQKSQENKAFLNLVFGENYNVNGEETEDDE